jgi:hypothetical protein
VYAREHVYEISMASLFVDYLSFSPDLWQNAANSMVFCNWVAAHLQAAPAYMPQGQPSVFDSLGQCYPGLTSLTPNMVVL